MNPSDAALRLAEFSDHVGRTSEATAFRVGRLASDRARIRGIVEDLYAVRSECVHTGAVAEPKQRKARNRSIMELLREGQEIVRKVPFMAMMDLRGTEEAPPDPAA